MTTQDVKNQIDNAREYQPARAHTGGPRAGCNVERP